MTYQAHTAPPYYQWRFEDALGGIPNGDAVIPSEASGAAFVSGNSESQSAQIADTDPVFLQYLRLSPPAGSRNIVLPNSGTFSPTLTNDEFTLDFHIRFQNTGSIDPLMGYEIYTAEGAPGGLKRFFVRVTRTDLRIRATAFGGMFNFDFTAEFPSALELNRWYAIRCGCRRGSPSVFSAHLDGTRFLYDSIGLAIDLPNSFVLVQNVVENVVSPKYVEIDRLAIFDILQDSDYAPTGVYDLFRFFESMTPQILFNPADLVFHTQLPASATLVGTGGTGPYTFVAASGELPAGLTLSEAGVISGTPLGLGSYKVGIKIIDAVGAESEADIEVRVTEVMYSTYRFAAGAIGLIPSNHPTEPRDTAGNIDGNQLVSQTIQLEAEAIARDIGHSSTGGVLRIYTSN